ncbi:hypothetical protein K440DRAFT_677651 [Wilcoxina mikolae CBS 423.85]|nr:hypothetical protein K440DRAFT_677651 [Wilcoxina mikolae CBS 423.85]
MRVVGECIASLLMYGADLVRGSNMGFLLEWAYENSIGSRTLSDAVGIVRGEKLSTLSSSVTRQWHMQASIEQYYYERDGRMPENKGATGWHGGWNDLAQHEHIVIGTQHQYVSTAASGYYVQGMENVSAILSPVKNPELCFGLDIIGP